MTSKMKNNVIAQLWSHTFITSTKNEQFRDPNPFYPQKRTINLLFKNNRICKHVRSFKILLPFSLQILINTKKLRNILKAQIIGISRKKRLDRFTFNLLHLNCSAVIEKFILHSKWYWPYFVVELE